MRALAAFIMKGRVQSVLAVCLLTFMSWFMPFMGLLALLRLYVGLLATAAIALPTLRKGAGEGAIVMVGAAAILALMGQLLGANPWQAGGYGLVVWIPAWLSAIALRESGRLALALIATAFLGMLAVLAIYGFYTDPAALWGQQLQGIVASVAERAPAEVDMAQMRRNVAEFARYLTGAAAAGSVLGIALSLFIARGWQAQLFNPDGFRTEFVTMRMYRTPAYVGLGLLMLAVIVDGMAEIAWNLVFPLFALFLLMGFSVLHGLFTVNKSRKFWLAGIYMALVFLPFAVVPIALIGLSDVWIDWRRRFPVG